jgi:hypothetical protein
MTQKQPDCRDILLNASDVLPQLYATKSFDSIRVAVSVMEQFCNQRSSEIFYIKTLLDIQQNTFSADNFSSNGRFDTLLQTYAFTVKTLKNGGYSINKYNYHFYSDPEKKFYTFIQNWASDLLNRQHLTSSESFICNVLAGNFRHPQATLKANKEEYPELYALLRKNYAHERSQFSGVATFMSGVWLPTGNLKILGTHPSVGFQLGGRGKSNEFDLVLQFKFVNTPNKYYVLRNDSLYGLNHFFGGYIGVDYSHYFLHSTNFEAGVIGGVGYDGFDIVDPPDNDHSRDYLKPFSIGSLNLNAGIRFNYFFNPRFFIGIIAKYNGISYGNKNGSSMSGYPVSIDFVIGR